MYLKSQLLEKLDERAYTKVELHKLFLAYERNEVYLPYFSYKYLLKSLSEQGHIQQLSNSSRWKAWGKKKEEKERLDAYKKTS